MRKTYRALAIAIVVFVALQAAFMAWAVASMEQYMTRGGVLDQSTGSAGGPPPFVGMYGLMMHGMGGVIVIPVLALALLVVSFFARFPRATMLASVVLGLVVLQVALGILGHSLELVGFLHGLNALALAVAAFVAQLRAARPSARSQQAAPAAATVAATDVIDA